MSCGLLSRAESRLQGHDYEVLREPHALSFLEVNWHLALGRMRCLYFLSIFSFPKNAANLFL